MKKILFLITGSIAAKKSFKVLKELKKNKIYVNCIVTDSAKKIIDKKDLKTKILGKVFYNFSENKKMLHITLARDCDLIVVCPATANSISKLAHGLGDDLSSTTLLTSLKKIILFPAMNVAMWNNVTNINNVKKLEKIGVEICGPEYGFLKCGEVGFGRLSEVKKIVTTILDNLNYTKVLSGRKCVVTAGPTIEPIDKIRYISNYSSGKQGYEIAKGLALMGAEVILIAGPNNLLSPPNIKLIKVVTGTEMNQAVKKQLPFDIGIFSAAVSDIKPKIYKNYKIKKNNLKNLSFSKNPDIIKNISNNKKKPIMLVGFAAETENLIRNAKKKIMEKGCDWIIANKISKENPAFGSDFNKITIVKKNKIIRYKKMPKILAAKKICYEIVNELEILDLNSLEIKN